MHELIGFLYAYRHRIEELYVISRRKQLAEVPRSLDWSDNKPIKLIDAFDRKITLPYEWCETWEVQADSSRRSQA